MPATSVYFRLTHSHHKLNSEMVKRPNFVYLYRSGVSKFVSCRSNLKYLLFFLCVVDVFLNKFFLEQSSFHLFTLLCMAAFVLQQHH